MTSVSSNTAILERKGVLGFTDEQRDYSDGVEGIVQMLRGQNPSEVLKDVHKAVDELNGDVLPEGVSIHPVFMDRTDLVGTTLHTVSRTLLEGMLLVLLRAEPVPRKLARCIAGGPYDPAVAAAVAFILTKATDIPANLLSLGAIDSRILVDGAIVMMETILKKRESRPEAELTKEGVIRRATQVARPIFFSTVIIITAVTRRFLHSSTSRRSSSRRWPIRSVMRCWGRLPWPLLLIPGLAFLAYRKPRKTYREPLARKADQWI